MQLAIKAGVSQTTIANWEQYRATPFLDQLRRVCAVLGIRIDQVALSPHEQLLITSHKVTYHLKAIQREQDNGLWIAQVQGVDPSQLPEDPENPYGAGLLKKPMDEADPATTSVVVPLTWRWESFAATPDAALSALAERITTSLDRCYE
jgi:transcriptional regulator with XRE-family HTH domain